MKNKKRINIPFIFILTIITIAIVSVFCFHTISQSTTHAVQTMDSYIEIPEITKENLAIEQINSINSEPIIVELDSITTDPTPVIIESAPVSTDLTISAIGDCTLGSDVNLGYANSFNSYYDKNSPDYFFSNVYSVLGQDDYTIANLEGTFTSSNNPSQKKFRFKGPEKYADILTAGSIEAVNLSNNHFKDYGETGYEDTKAALEKRGIDFFDYDNVLVKQIKGIKIGLISFSEWSSTADMQSSYWKNIKKEVKDKLKQLDEQGVDIKIVTFHWGLERAYVQNAEQVSLAHYAIDNGADLVLGHHPHVLQGIEKYKDKLICYSLGNFCFGGNTNPPDKDSMIFQVTFSFVDGIQKEMNYEIIPVSISSSKNKNDFKPIILTGKEKERVLNKIDFIN
ncbi:MAG: CapA family protein [Oscillospiraceae bacterium]|nr:CapA family protein [Oscillospiraceae bacterium]